MFKVKKAQVNIENPCPIFDMNKHANPQNKMLDRLLSTMFLLEVMTHKCLPILFNMSPEWAPK